MAIHYDKKTGRFKDDSGRFVAKAKAMRSSIARREYESATKPAPKKTQAARPGLKPAGPKPAARKRAAPIPVKKPVRPVVAKSAPPRKAKPVKPKPAPVRVPKPTPAPRVYPPHIGEQEGIIEEFPEEWFPDPGSEDDFDWDDIEDIWGDYEDADTTSAGPDGSDGGGS